LAKKTTVPALQDEAAPPKVWDEMSSGEKLAANADLSLDIIRQILALEIDPENVKLLAQIKDVALTVISQQIRVDEGKLRPPASEGRLVEYEAAVAAYERSLLSKPSKDEGEP
jgi:hypothetical protein